MPAPTSVRLLLVDDHPIMRTGLANVLNKEPDFAVVAEAGDGLGAIELWRKLQPDVALLDVSMPGFDGIQTLEKLRSEFPLARVLMLTASEAAEDARQALRAGALGYITKDVSREVLVAAIHAVFKGQSVVGESIARELEAASAPTDISQREAEVLALIRQGFTNAEIGRLLGITERTARAHVGSLLVKLDAADRAAAVARGFELGLLKR